MASGDAAARRRCVSTPCWGRRASERAGQLVARPWPRGRRRSSVGAAAVVAAAAGGRGRPARHRRASSERRDTSGAVIAGRTYPRPVTSRRACSSRSTARQVEVPDDGASLLEVAARPPRRPLGQGRLQPPGPVRLLHGAGRRRPPGRLRDAGCGGWPAGASPPLDGLDADDRDGWADAFCATGASQCGFCTPGIIVRLEGARPKGADLADEAAVDRALAAHLCRAPAGARSSRPAGRARRAGRRAGTSDAAAPPGRRSRAAAPQRVGPEVALGAGGVRRRHRAAPTRSWPCPTARAAGRWARRCRGPPRPRARCRAGARPSTPRRRSTVPDGRLGPHPADVLGRARLPRDRRLVVRAGRRAGRRRSANGGAFGGKVDSPVAGRRPARWPTSTAGPCGCVSREDTVRLGPEAPAARRRRRAGRHRRRPGRRARRASPSRRSVAPGLDGRGGRRRRPADVDGAAGRGLGRGGRAAGRRCRGDVGWIEAARRRPGHRRRSSTARIAGRGSTPASRSTRSCCARTASAPPTWRSAGCAREGLAVDDDGRGPRPDHPLVRHPAGRRHARGRRDDRAVRRRAPVNGSDAVFAAVAAAAWLDQGCPPELADRPPLPLTP